MKKRPWIAMFSQTGNEILKLSSAINRSPNFIIGNHRDNTIPKINSRIESSTVYVSNKPTAEELTVIFDTFENPIITLHGWLRIIPAEVCGRYEIYNGHPGYIVDYPELKGLNPQDKVSKYIKDYREIGSVVHEVVPEVDAGAIITECKMVNKYYKKPLPKQRSKVKDYVYNTSTITSLMAWMDFSKEYL